MRGAVLAVITTVIILYVGLLVTVNFLNQATPDATWSASANTTWANAQTYTWLAFGFIALGILILGVVAILAALGMMGGTRT